MIKYITITSFCKMPRLFLFIPISAIALFCSQYVSFSDNIKSKYSIEETKVQNYGVYDVGSTKTKVIENILFQNITDKKSCSDETISMVIKALVKRNVKDYDKLIIPIDLEYKRGASEVGIYSIILLIEGKNQKVSEISALHTSHVLCAKYRTLLAKIASKFNLENIESIVTHQRKANKGNNNEVNKVATEFNIKMLLEGVEPAKIGERFNKANYNTPKSCNKHKKPKH